MRVRFIIAPLVVAILVLTTFSSSAFADNVYQGGSGGSKLVLSAEELEQQRLKGVVVDGDDGASLGKSASSLSPGATIARHLTLHRKTVEWGGNNCSGVAGGPQNCIASTAACTTGTNYSIDAGGVAVPRATASSRTRAEGEVTMESVTTARPATGCACGTG